jgi:hypothetical protein
MFNRLIQSFENITTAILARFVKYDHNIDGSHRPWIDAQNYASFAAAVDACGPAGSNPCNLIISSNIPVASNRYSDRCDCYNEGICDRSARQMDSIEW